MLHPAKAGVAPAAVAAAARRRLKALSRPAGEFDASRYFRGGGDLGFYNCGTTAVREMAAEIVRERRGVWTVDDALAFADALMPDRVLEVKGLGIEVMARYRREFTPRLLGHWKGWLSHNEAANWATTDTICGMLIRPLLQRYPPLIDTVRTWVRHRNVWVRRAAAVSLVAAAHRGEALDAAYEVAAALHHDPADLVQKAVGWLLREAGVADSRRLERYLRAHGAGIPRITIRYALEKFPAPKRRALLEITKRAGRQR